MSSNASSNFSRVTGSHRQSLAQTRTNPDERKVGASRILPQARRVPLSVLLLVAAVSVTVGTFLRPNTLMQSGSEAN
jgi:hypothetical protein